MPHVPEPRPGGPPDPPPPQTAETPPGRRPLPGVKKISLKNWDVDPAEVLKILKGMDADADRPAAG